MVRNLVQILIRKRSVGWVRNTRTTLVLSLMGLLLGDSLLPVHAMADDAKAILDAAYNLTKTAKTIEDYDEVIVQCQNAQRTKLPDELEAYSKRLLSWAHNRRGEALSEQAAQETDRNQAKQLDVAALADFEKAVEYEPDRWKALHNRGVSFAISGKYEQALRDFDRVTKLKPDYVNAWFNRAEIRLELRQYEGALQDYDEVLNISPDDPGALVGRGRALLRLGRGSDAIVDLDKAVKTAPSADVFAVRGEVHEHLGEWEKAAKDIRKAVELDPNSGRAFVALAWMVATCPDERYRDEALALQAAQKAIELDGDSKDFRHLDVMAAALANAKRFPEAKKQIEDAIKVAPSDEVAELKKRQALYAQSKPYRMEPAK